MKTDQFRILKLEALILTEPSNRLDDVQFGVNIVIMVHVRKLENVGLSLTFSVVLYRMFDWYQFIFLTMKEQSRAVDILHVIRIPENVTHKTLQIATARNEVIDDIS